MTTTYFSTRTLARTAPNGSTKVFTDGVHEGTFDSLADARAWFTTAAK